MRHELVKEARRVAKIGPAEIVGCSAVQLRVWFRAAIVKGLPPFPLTRRYERDRDATGRSEE
jgi:hypothetical protein